MNRIVRLLIVAIVAGAVATIVAQRERLRELDREELVGQVRNAMETRFNRGDRTAESPAVETVGTELDARIEQTEEAVENAEAEAEDASS